MAKARGKGEAATDLGSVAQAPRPPTVLSPEQRDNLRTFVARRVPELARDAPELEGSTARARRAKGEWMLSTYESEGPRVGAALLCEVIADSYGVPR